MKKTITLLLTIALFLTFAAFAVGSGSSGEAKVEAGEKSDSGAQASQNARTEIRAGETLNMNGFKITYDGAEKWVSDNMFIQPAEGKEYIRLHFSVTNETDSDKYVSMFEFDCYADGEKCEMEYIGDDALSTDSISTGRKTSGYIYFEVPGAASEIEVEYETSFWTDKKAFFVVEL